MNKLTDKSRRGFLAAGLMAGLAACKSGADPFTPEDQPMATGEKVKLLSVDGEIIEVDKAFLKPVPDHSVISNAQARAGIPGKSFVMVIDLSRCKNLKKCIDACDHMHHLHPGEHYVKVHAMQEAEETAPYWQPTICMHCDEPPCVKVCPVDATFKRQDGIVLIDNDRCVGCRFCMAACPYSTRVFNWEQPDLDAAIANMTSNPESGIPQKMGTVGKCDFCTHMIRESGDLPHCVTACPNGVYMFGDMNEDVVSNGAETFRFSDLIKDKAGYRLMEDLGTKPRVYYLPPVNRSFPFESGLDENESMDNHATHH